MPESKPLHIETELSRDLGLTSAMAIGVGTMIAAGIFTLSGLAIGNVGSAAVVAFVLAAVVALFTALTYCEFVAIYPESGEGYLYARRTFQPISAYFVGCALFLGYTSSCAFYIASLSIYFQEFIWHSPVESLAGVACLIALVLLNVKGTKESGTFQVVVTVSKVMLLMWFVVGGIGSVRAGDVVERFRADLLQIGGTAALVFITFFGFSAIAASAGEVKEPGKTIPRAIFLSMGIVTVLYTLVVVTMIAANLTEYSESAMGNAARKFLGPIGGMVIVAGALFSMISASNASIMAGSRVMLSMSRLGHLPRGFGAVNPQTRTPIVSVVLVGGTILLFAVSLPLQDLAHFADTVLLIALILVNVALIVHRRKHPDIERPFRVPLVPLLPALGILANLYLLGQIVHHPVPMTMALSCLCVGLLAFVAWKGLLPAGVSLPGAPSRVAMERSAVAGAHPFRVLVPLANPANVEQLIDIAGAVASQREGEIVTLRVAVAPEQLPPSREDAYVERERHVLELAHETALQYDLPVRSLIRVGHDAARAILETAKDYGCDLILMGWKGYTSTAEKILGEVVDTVVRHAECDVLLVKQTTRKPLRRFLLPTAGGEHARCAEEYVKSLVRARDGSLTVCVVVSPDAADDELAEANTRLDKAVERIAGDGTIDLSRKLIRHDSVPVGVLQESQDYDAIVVGASRQRGYQHLLFGNIPESIARSATCPVILVKHHHPVRAFLHRVLGREVQE